MMEEGMMGEGGNDEEGDDMGIGKDMGNPWVSNSQPVPIPTSNPYP